MKSDQSPETTNPQKINDKAAQVEEPASENGKEAEIGGPKGLEPTRYGDWERKGRCVDF